MALSREISQHFLEKWGLENPGLEVLLWLEKGKILCLNCKTCIKFENEINSMSAFKKTCINGYSGGRLVS